jgi:hypothetical protein
MAGWRRTVRTAFLVTGGAAGLVAVYWAIGEASRRAVYLSSRQTPAARSANASTMPAADQSVRPCLRESVA